MIQHSLEIQREVADAIMLCDKTFEIRYNDGGYHRGYQKGDLIRFRVMDGPCDNPSHKLNEKTYKITYVLSGWGLNEGYVALGIKEEEHSGKDNG